jgi:hypothetical protein
MSDLGEWTADDLARARRSQLQHLFSNQTRDWVTEFTEPTTGRPPFCGHVSAWRR